MARTPPLGSKPNQEGSGAYPVVPASGLDGPTTVDPSYSSERTPRMDDPTKVDPASRAVPARTNPRANNTWMNQVPAAQSAPQINRGLLQTERPPPGATPSDPGPPVPRAQQIGVGPTMLGAAGSGAARQLSAPGSPPPSSVVANARGSMPSGGARGSYSSMSAIAEGTILPKVCPQCAMRYPPEFNVCPKDAAELTDAEGDDDEFVGRILAETYAIIRVVGEGGMGRVYEARHTRIGGKRFAVKLLHPEYARLPEVLSRFQREAEAAASIESPHVGDVYDIGRTEDGRPFIVAEFLEGRELADYLKEKGRLDTQLAVRIVRQVCKALVAAHALGIVHRDMKPENVFLVGDLAAPTAKVIDFGISKVKEAGGASLTKTGMIMGTPAYMAPEQAKGERVDHRVDIYAAGAILYELVTGKRPFDRLDPTATIMAVLLEDPERPCVLNPSLPEALEMVIQRAMAKSADARYQTMDELEAELTSFVERGHALASVAPPPHLMGGAPAATGPRTTMEARERDVALSRPTIALLGAIGGFGVLTGLLTIVASVLRMARGGSSATNVTSTESLLLVTLLTLALATPMGFAIYLVKKNIWGNSAKTLALAAAMKQTVLSAFVTYGVVSLTIRFTESLIMRRAAGIAWPVWDLVAVLAAIIAGAGTYLTLKVESRR